MAILCLICVGNPWTVIFIVVSIPYCEFLYSRHVNKPSANEIVSNRNAYIIHTGNCVQYIRTLLYTHAHLYKHVWVRTQVHTRIPVVHIWVCVCVYVCFNCVYESSSLKLHKPAIQMIIVIRSTCLTCYQAIIFCGIHSFAFTTYILLGLFFTFTRQVCSYFQNRYPLPILYNLFSRLFKY